MIATAGGKLEKKRTGVVRTNGMISLFPFKGDRDFAVRYDPNDPAGKHNIYEVEVTTNVMRGNFFVELDRLGVFDKTELGGKKDADIPKKEREVRIQALFDAVFNYSGGAHLSNYFTKAYPEIITVAILKRKLPVIGDKLVVTGKKKENGKYIIDKDRLEETIKTFEDNIEELFIGGFETVIENWNEIKGFANAKIKVLSLKDMKKEISDKKFFV
jgi:CRISPR-associated protein Cst2